MALPSLPTASPGLRRASPPPLFNCTAAYLACLFAVFSPTVAFYNSVLFCFVFSPHLCCYLFQPQALSLEMRLLGFALACRVHHPAEDGGASVWHLLIVAAPQSFFCFSCFLVQNDPLKITER